MSEEKLELQGIYTVECVGPVEERRDEYVALRDALETAEAERNAAIAASLRLQLQGISTEVKWKDSVRNLVTTVGKNKILDTALGNAAGGAVIMGLKGTGAAAAGDTQASHAGWLEVGLANAPTYSGTRGSPAFSAASAGSKATSAAVAFAITSAGTVAGCFINIGGTTAIDNTTGVLLSAGDFSASRTVANGDTVNVSYSLAV